MKLVFLILLFESLNSIQSMAQSRTRVILLGTGTPNADPKRDGPATAILVDGFPYVVDCGPGVVRSAVAAGINVKLLNKLFITHLHSDHTAGYPDFLLTPAVLERNGPLKIFGLPGTAKLNDYIKKAYQEDITLRTLGLEHGDSIAYTTEVKETVEGTIYKDSRIEVVAFKVNHGSWPNALGYKFITPDKTIVLSGDCTYSENVVKACHNCDILIHEVYCEEGYKKRPEAWKKYHAVFHSSTTQVAKVAMQSQPKLLILNHILIWDSHEDELVTEINTTYKGKVVIGKDRDVY